MKNRVLGVLSGLLLTAGAAFGQCNTWNTTMQLAPPDGMLIYETLDSGDDFLLFASSSEQYVVIMVGEYGGMAAILGWSDTNGVGTVSDGTITTKFMCDSHGLTVSVVMPGIEEQWFAVTTAGQVMKLGRSAYRQAFTSAFGALETDNTLEIGSPLTASSPYATGTTVGSASFSVDALEVEEIYTDPVTGDVLSSWAGTLTGPSGSEFCMGYTLASSGVYLVAPTVAFCDPNDATAVSQYLTQTNALNNLCPTCQTSICANWDITAAGELALAINDSNACATSRKINHGATALLCGAGAVVTCFTSLIPNPISAPLCWTSISCLFGTSGHWARDMALHANEWNRVKNCMCINANIRALGGTTGTCTFSCP